MKNKAYFEVSALLTRIQNYQGLPGLQFVKTEVERICTEHNYQLTEAQDQFLKACENSRHGRLELAADEFESCIELCQDFEQELSIHAYLYFGSLKSDFEDFESAYDTFDHVLTYSHLLDQNTFALACTNISDMYLSLELYEKAVDIAARGVEVSLAINNTVNHGLCLMNLGLSYGLLDRYAEAMTHLKEALTIALASQEERNIAIAHAYLAQVLARAGAAYADEAMTHFSTAQTLFQSQSDGYSRIENLVHYARFLLNQGLTTAALEICLKVEASIGTQQHSKLYSLHCQTLIRIYRRREDWISFSNLSLKYQAELEKQLSRAQRHERELIIRNSNQAESLHQQTLADKTLAHIETIHEIGTTIATTQNLSDSLPFIYQCISAIFPTDEFGIATFDKETGLLDYRYFYNQDGFTSPCEVNIYSEHSLGAYAIHHQQTIHINNITDQAIGEYVREENRSPTDKVIHEKAHEMRSVMLTPIVLDNTTLGLLSIQHSKTNQYHQHHRKLFEKLANFIAISLQNQEQRQHLEEANRRLETMSRTDPLTGLYNRYQLDHLVPKMVDRAQELEKPVTLSIIDVDYYKGFNDHHGHQEGDRALQLLADTMRSSFSEHNDHMFRYGGDEFLVVSYGQEEHEVADKLKNFVKQVAHLELSNPNSKCSQFLTLSIGVASCYRNQGQRITNFDRLFNLADKALYKVKEQGRNSISFSETTCCV